MHEQKNKWKGVFFLSRTCKARKTFRVLKCHVSGKWGGFVKIYSNSLGSNLFRGSNLRQNIPPNPWLGVIWTKMCVGVYFKTFVYACVHLHIWVAPLGKICVSICKDILLTNFVNYMTCTLVLTVINVWMLSWTFPLFKITRFYHLSNNI